MHFNTQNDPSHKIDEMRTIYSYLSVNGLTILDSAQAMTLLAALPKEWGSFAMTLLVTLPLNINQAGVAAGIPQLTFSNVVSKIQEEWSHHSGRSIMPRDEKQIIKKEHNTVAKESTPRCRKCKGRHVTSDHRDDYKCPNIPQIAPHAYLNRPLQQNKAPKKKGDKKGKGGPRQNEASISQNLLDGGAFIIELNSDNESDGYASDQADAGWSTLTPLHLATDSQTVTTVTFCNPHQRIPESSASFPSPHAQSRKLTLIPDSEHPFPIMLDHSQPDRAQPNRLYLSLVSSSSLSLASPHTLPLPLSRSLHLTLLVLRLRQPYTT